MTSRSALAKAVTPPMRLPERTSLRKRLLPAPCRGKKTHKKKQKKKKKNVGYPIGHPMKYSRATPSRGQTTRRA